MTPKNYIIPIFVPHLGCPNECVFCNQRHISGQLSRQTAENVSAIIQEALKKIPHNAKIEAAFYGGSFTAIPYLEQEELLNAVLPFLESGKIASLRLSTRPDCVDESSIERLLKYRVKTVELGVQSMCDDVLKASGRGHTAEVTEHAVKLLQRANFEFVLQMMTGLPGDTPEKSIYTANKIADMRPNGVRIYPTVIIRDTALYDMWLRGIYKEHTIEQASELCALLVPIFQRAGIPVIRLGLNPSEELSGGMAAAGAYHPAFGQLVYSRIYLEKARMLLKGESIKGKDIVLFVAKGQTSVMAGQKRINIEKLKDEFGVENIKITELDMEKGEIRLSKQNCAINEPEAKQ